MKIAESQIAQWQKLDSVEGQIAALRDAVQAGDISSEEAHAVAVDRLWIADDWYLREKLDSGFTSTRTGPMTHSGAPQNSTLGHQFRLSLHGSGASKGTTEAGVFTVRSLQTFLERPEVRELVDRFSKRATVAEQVQAQRAEELGYKDPKDTPACELGLGKLVLTKDGIQRKGSVLRGQALEPAYERASVERARARDLGVITSEEQLFAAIERVVVHVETHPDGWPSESSAGEPRMLAKKPRLLERLLS